MESQNTRLLAYLKKHKTIQPLEAWLILGIYRLGARIYDLRNSGYNITSKKITKMNRFNEPCHLAEYRLGE